MKKFQFSLERVLRYHEQRLKQAELRVAVAAAERDAAQTAVFDCEQRIVQACQTSETVGAIINPAIRTNVTALIEQLSKILKTAQERLKAADQRFRETDRVRAQIDRDLEGFKQLRDLRRQEHRDEVNRRQQIELDEVVMRRWSAESAADALQAMEMLE
jgi:flagellar export protein FliJ